MVIRRQNKARNRLLVLLGLAITISITVTAIFFSLQAKPQKSSYTGPTEDISTGLIGEYAALIWIAQDRGYFKSNGLNVTLTEYESGPDAINAMITGKNDLALGSGFAAVRSSLNNEDIKILSTVSRSEAFYLVGRKDHGISKINNLKGKKIGITPKTAGEFFLGQFLTINYLDRQDIIIVSLPQSELANAVVDGRIDAAVLFEPNAYQANLRLGSNAVKWSVQSGQSIYTSLYATSKLTRERPQAIKRYLKALIEAEEYLKSNSQQARAIIARQLNYDQDYINYVWSNFSFEVSLEQELLMHMDDEARWAIENRLTTTRKIPNYLKLIYFDGLEAVKPEGITIIR